jgi:DNA-binding transcriptional MerR regulator
MPMNNFTYKEGISPNVDPKRSQIVIDAIRERSFLLRETGVTPRVFNLWKKTKLIDVSYSSYGREWMRLSFIDYLWLKIIVDLRKFGLSLENILEVKKVCLADFQKEIAGEITEQQITETILTLLRSNKVDVSPETVQQTKELILKAGLGELVRSMNGSITYLEMAVRNMIVTRSSIDIVIVSNDNLDRLYGTANRDENKVSVFLDTSEKDKMTVPEGVNIHWEHSVPHIRLPLRNYIAEFLQDEKHEKYLPKLELLDANEYKLLTVIRKGMAKEIEIKFKNGRLDRMGVTTNVSKAEEARLLETFTKNEYAEISYSVEKGKIVRFNKTTKVLLNS